MKSREHARVRHLRNGIGEAREAPIDSCRPLDLTVNWALEPKAEARMEAAALPCPLETAQTLAKEARPHPMKALQHLAEVVDRLAGFSDPCPSWNQLTPRSNRGSSR